MTSHPPHESTPGDSATPENPTQERTETTLLTPTDAAHFLELLENPPAPNAAIRSAAEAYQQLISRSE